MIKIFKEWDSSVIWIGVVVFLLGSLMLTGAIFNTRMDIKIGSYCHQEGYVSAVRIKTIAETTEDIACYSRATREIKIIPQNEVLKILDK